MHIEISAGGIPSLIAVENYQTNMSVMTYDIESVISCFKGVREATYNLNGGVGNLQEAVDDIGVRLQEEERKKTAVENVRHKTNDFLDLAIRVDNQVAVAVGNNSDEFYRVNPWLRPVTSTDERAWYEKVFDGLCNIGKAIADGLSEAWNWVTDTAKKIWDGLVDFYEQNKKIIDTIAVVVLAVVAVAAIAGTGGAGGVALAPLLADLGVATATAETISLAVATTAVVSTVGAATMNVADIWLEIDDPAFNTVQKSLNIVSAVSNLTYSVGTIYNSVNHITSVEKYMEGKNVITNTNQLNGKQVSALTEYTGEGCYRNINNSLRGSEVATSGNTQIIKTMDSALDNASLPSDMTLYRGTSQNALGDLKGLSPDELVGKVFTENGYMSTTTSSTVAQGWANDMKMTIEAAQGSHALDISQISNFPWEQEVLFARGQEMMIVSAENVKGVLDITVVLK